MEITKATITNAIFNNFYDRIKDKVTTVTASVSSGPTTGNTWTIQKYSSSYSDVDFSSKSNFPIIAINSPRIPQEQLTFRKTKVNGIVEIDVFATNSQVADKFLDAVNEAIETYKTTFASLGLKQLELDDTDSDFIEHGKIKIHLRTVRWRFVYYYERTEAF